MNTRSRKTKEYQLVARLRVPIGVSIKTIVINSPAEAREHLKDLNYSFYEVIKKETTIVEWGKKEI